MRKRLLLIGSKIIPKQFKPFLRPIKNKIFSQPKPVILFEGWGLTTWTQLPWIDDNYFKDTNSLLKHRFDFGKKEYSISDSNVDEMMYRNYYITYCVRNVLKNTENRNFVECGVANGLSAFFALREIKSTRYEFHLYDSWAVMKTDYLNPNEHIFAGNYDTLDINLTKNNLKDFENVKFHCGYLPETLNESAPKLISYLHIDVNSAKTTKEILDFFYPRLVSGGVILFDDYGWLAHDETRKLVDSLFDNILKLPTGQAIFYKL